MMLQYINLDIFHIRLLSGKKKVGDFRKVRGLFIKFYEFKWISHTNQESDEIVFFNNQ
jgi:hypothetical protein